MNKNHLRNIWVVAAIAAASSFALVGCGGGQDNTADTSILSADPSTTAAALRHRRPTPTPTPSPTPTPTPTPAPGSVAPTLNITATPASIVAGQSSTVTWTTSNTTGCTASGAWSGARATSGSMVVAPAVTAAYTLDCVGAGGSVSSTANLSVNVTGVPAVATPSLGAHGMVFHGIGGSVGPLLSTPAATTQSGSTMLAFLGKGSIWGLSAPIDNKGNTPYAQLGAVHEYTRWPGQGSAVYAFNAIVGGTNHIVSEDDANTFDEVSFATVEVRNGGVVQDIKWNEVLNATLQTSQSVTTTGPATLVAVWYGDDASSTPSNPVPNNGFTVIHGNPNGSQSVQMFVATKDVPTAGTYNVTWTTTPLQGAQLYLVAVQGK